jgi:hypothetical protein
MESKNLEDINNSKYTYDVCKTYAKICKSKTEFKKKYRSVYMEALRNGWIEDFKDNWGIKLHNSKYTYDVCKKLASECETKSEFSKKYKSAYREARERGWLENLNDWKVVSSKFTFEVCQILALSCENIKEFQLNYPGAANQAWKRGWTQKLRNWKITKHKYSFEECQEIANLCESKTEFQNNYQAYYQTAYKHGWVNDLKDWEPYKPVSKYSYAACKKLADTCNSISEFKLKYAGAYFYAKRNGFLYDLQDWKSGNLIYDFETCQEIAKKYNTKSEFKNKDRGAHDSAWRQGFLNDLKDLEEIGDKYKRLIYAYLFILENGEYHIYVGLTYNMKMRHAGHMSQGPVHDFIKKHKNEILNPIEPILMSEYLPVKEAQKMEEFQLQHGIEMGFIPLNRGITGGLGTCNGFYSTVIDGDYI